MKSITVISHLRWLFPTLVPYGTKGGMHFRRPQGGCMVFPRAKTRLYGFIQTGAFNYLKGAHHNPRGLKGRVKLKPL